MKLLEYEAKRILADAGILVPRFSIVKLGDNGNFPLILKSQVPTGGRGKAGGILVIETQAQLNSGIDKLMNLSIKGFQPRALLAEEKISVKKELYLSILVDRQSAVIKIVAHRDGGIDVEENTDFETWAIEEEPEAEHVGRALANYYELPDQIFEIQNLVKNLFTCFVQNDATLIEINPLILTTKNSFVASDCKMTLDDAAAFRHNWNFEQKPAEVNFVTIDSEGNTATIANGAGLAMATVDAVYEAGLKPANFLDIGGGANQETLFKALERIVKYKNLQAIIINIFAGITRADEVARAIVAARTQIKNLPPLFIRLAGTNYEAAEKILTENNIPILQNLESAIEAAAGVVHE